ncbi:MAG: 50S ribosomal protein L10 [bacterium]
MNKQEKIQVVSALREKFSRAKMALLTDYRGMTVAEITGLRKKLRGASVEYSVVKNSLARIASDGTTLEPIKDQFEGPTAVVLSYGDPVAPAKILTDALKEFKNLGIRSGVFEGAVLSKADIAKIASLPSREVLLGMFLRVLQGPLTGFITVMQAPLRNLLTALNAVKEKKAA